MRSTLDISLKLLVRTIPFALILIGISYVLLNRQVAAISVAPINHITLPEPTKATQANTPDRAFPIRIAISDLGVNLDIKPGAYDKTTGQWNMDDRSAYIATEPATPIIYAHNRPSLFYPLRNVNENTVMSLHHSDGTVVNYTYVKTRFVTPDDGRVLAEINPRTVILLTCSGLFDETRRLVYFQELL